MWFGGGELISSRSFLAICSTSLALLTIFHTTKFSQLALRTTTSSHDRMKTSSLFSPLSETEPLRTPEQVRSRFERSGISVAAWARSQGFNVVLTYMVAAGQRKSLRGQSHQIAVALGMKRGDDTEL